MMDTEYDFAMLTATYWNRLFRGVCEAEAWRFAETGLVGAGEAPQGICDASSLAKVLR